MTELAIVGDIHGRADALDNILAKALQRTDQFIFLGDYVNRGPNSRQVIERLLRLRDNVDCRFLAGNHDRAMARSLDGGFDEFLTMGGAATVRSYIEPPYRDVAEEFVTSVPPSHRDFLRSLEDEVVTSSLRVAHRIQVPPGTAKFHISGHSPQASLVPTITADAAYIDTGCGTLVGGRLTCFFWPSRTWTSYPAA